MSTILEQFRPVESARIHVQTHTAVDGVPVITRPAVYSSLPREAYDAMKGWNASLLKVVLERTLGHAWYEFIRPDRKDREDVEAFVKGNQLHTLLLEPELYQQRYVVPPADLPKRPTEKQLEEPSSKPGTRTHDTWLDAKAREEAWQQFEQGLPAGARIISAAQHDEVQAWADAVLRHQSLGPLFAPEFRHLNELTLAWLDPITKAPCKARLDALRILPGEDGQPTIRILDLKTAAKAGEDFDRSAGSFMYPVSATFYAHAVYYCRGEIERYLGLSDGALIGAPVFFEWVGIEKTAPHFIDRKTLGDEEAALSGKLIRRAIDLVVNAEARGWWPAYPDEARPIQLPGWWFTSSERLVAKLDVMLEAMAR